MDYCAGFQAQIQLFYANQWQKVFWHPLELVLYKRASSLPRQFFNAFIERSFQPFSDRFPHPGD